MPAILEKPRASNMTVKRERLKSLAIAKKRTPHYLMKEAIQTYLEKEEVEQRVIATAQASLKHYKETGLHITHEELSAWVEALHHNPKAEFPVCHT
jgi:predicted transcriptional regulator